MLKTKRRMTMIAMAIFTLAFSAISVGTISRPQPVEAYSIQHETPEEKRAEAITAPQAAEKLLTLTTASNGEETADSTPATEPTDEPLDDPELAVEREDQQPDKLYTYYDVPLDNDLQEYAQDLCEHYEFPYYNVVVAMIGRESSFREGVVSETNDYGYMQINVCNHQTLREELGIYDLLDGRQNVQSGIYILQQLYHKYGDIWLALMAYNCGETGASELWAQGIYSTAYSRGIMQDADALTIRTS